MEELSLTEQDVVMLVEALDLLLLRVEGKKAYGQLEASIRVLQERFSLLSNNERLQSIAAIAQALKDISDELNCNESGRN